jgi:hypothetical protein
LAGIAAEVQVEIFVFMALAEPPALIKDSARARLGAPHELSRRQRLISVVSGGFDDRADQN